MSEWKELETQLRSWIPRRPSAGLRSRVFGAGAAAGRHPAIAWNWLAPATGGVMLLFVTLSQQNGAWSRFGVSGEAPMVALTLSNQSLAAYLPGSFSHEQNSVPADTFEWTNRSRSPSSMGSFSRTGTNELTR
jgi:hypothetical protein